MTSTAPRLPPHLPDEIVGERVRLRPYRPGDGAALFEAVQEDRAHLHRWLPWIDQHRTPEASEDTARRLQQRWRTCEDLTVGVWDRTGTQLLGGSGLHHADWDVPSFEIGYWLRRSAEGQGYMTETVRLLCRLAFETLGAVRVVIRCDAANHRSAAVPRRLGFRHESTLRDELPGQGGVLRDMLVFVLTSEDYVGW